MKTKAMIRSVCAIMLACLFAVSFAACAGSKTVTVTVNDMGTATELETQTGLKISEILKEAEIGLGDKDETEPAADTALTEDTKTITVKRYAKVTVVKGSEKKEVELVGGTVEDAVKKSGITLSDGDQPDQDLKAYLKDGMTVTITQGLKVSITVDGSTKEVTTGGVTVKELLDKEGVKLGKDDICSEKLDAAVTDGMKITIKRVTFKEVTEKEKIDYETEEEYDSSLSSGESKVTQEGVEGEKEVTYKVKYEDGKEKSREKVSEKVTKEAVNEVVAYGTKEEISDEPEQPAENYSPQEEEPAGKTVVKKTPYYNCDGSGHGFYEILYSDGTSGVETF